MVGEPVSASVALIAVMLGAWLGAVGIGVYVVWVFLHGVDASSGVPWQGPVDRRIDSYVHERLALFDSKKRKKRGRRWADEHN